MLGAEKMTAVSAQENPNIEEIEDIYIKMKKLLDDKTEKLAVIL